MGAAAPASTASVARGKVPLVELDGFGEPTRRLVCASEVVPGVQGIRMVRAERALGVGEILLVELDGFIE